MKKLFSLAIICLTGATIIFNSCNNQTKSDTLVVNGTAIDQIDASKLDNTTPACWEITYTDGKQTEVSYAWGTEQMIVQILQKAYKEAKEDMSGLSCSYKKNNVKDSETCWNMNPDYDEDNPGGDNTLNPGGNGGNDDPNHNIDPATLDNTTPKCWEVTVSYGSYSMTQFLWMTERALVESMQKQPLPFTYKQASANSEEACYQLGGGNQGEGEGEEDQDDANSSCWKVTYTIYGMTFTEYMWDIEKVVSIYVQTLQKNGMTDAKYEKSSAKTEAECDALDDAENN